MGTMWAEKTAHFIRRQFSPSATRWQVGFDTVFGILTPIVCLVADPFVFTQSLTRSDPGLSGWRVFAFTAVAGGALALLLTWLSRGRNGWLTNMVVIPFALGAVATLLVGWKAALASLIMLAFVIASVFSTRLTLYAELAPLLALSLFGLTPLLTVFVYGRTVARAVQVDPWQVGVFGSPQATRAQLLGVALLLGVPAGLQLWANDFVRTRVDRLLNEPTPQPAVVTELKTAFWCTPACYAAIVREYDRATTADRGGRLADVYLDLTGIVLQPDVERFQDRPQAPSDVRARYDERFISGYHLPRPRQVSPISVPMSIGNTTALVIITVPANAGAARDPDAAQGFVAGTAAAGAANSPPQAEQIRGAGARRGDLLSGFFSGHCRTYQSTGSTASRVRAARVRGAGGGQSLW